MWRPGQLYHPLEVPGQSHGRRHDDLRLGGLSRGLQDRGQVEHVDRELVIGGGQVVGQLRLGPRCQVERVQGQGLDQLGLAFDGGQEAQAEVGPEAEHLDGAVLVTQHDQPRVAPVADHHLGLAGGARTLAQLQPLPLPTGCVVLNNFT